MAEAATTDAPETLVEAETDNPSTQEMELEAPNAAAAEEAPAGAAATNGGELNSKPETLVETETDNPSTQDMELEAPNAAAAEEAPADAAATNGGELNSKRAMEKETDSEEDEGGAKKQKVEKSAEEERLDKLEGAGGTEEVEVEEEPVRVSVGPKSFGSSVEMFDYFYKFLHFWSPNVNVNKFEHMVLLELLKKGHLEPEKKIGKGILAFQVRFHPQFRSRCFFIIRNDESVDDFSFRKCVDHILPLPENMQAKSDVNKKLGGGGGGGHGKKSGGGGGRGGGGRGGRGYFRGRGGKSRN